MLNVSLLSAFAVLIFALSACVVGCDNRSALVSQAKPAQSSRYTIIVIGSTMSAPFEKYDSDHIRHEPNGIITFDTADGRVTTNNFTIFDRKPEGDLDK